MAVIITDMEMPSMCAWCEFGERWDNASVLCKRKPEEEPTPDWVGRPSFCPLKEVTEIKTAGNNKIPLKW